ncbi:MAG: SAM-dependent methyltransferase [Ktedonobacterales bacterium]
MFYTYGMKVGAELMARGQVTPALRHLIIPISYWRSAEFALVYDAADFRPTDRVLDIGSPKLLSLYLAKKLGADVYSTDIDGYFLKEYTLLRNLEHLSSDKFHVEVEDGRKLSYADSFFDKVFAVSVVEHIPENGDAECMREVARVLRPGGRCMLTVPFSPESRNEYRQEGEFYWAQSSTTGEDGRVFFQRRYSEQDLHDRLITPSGLTVRNLLYVGEKGLEHSDRELFEHLPAITHPMLGPVQALMAKAFLTPPTADWRSLRKPRCALVCLERPAES